MSLTVNNVATFDSQAANIEILQSLVKNAKVYAPAVETYMKNVPTMGSRIEWFDQNLGNNAVTLSGAYTAGSGTMTIAASSLRTPYDIKVGVHQLMTQSGSAYYNIVNKVGNTLTIALSQGTDANIASGVQLWLVRDGAIGADAGAQNDIQLATSDYNYISNFNFTVRISNPNKNGQLQYVFEELTFDNQLQNNIPEAIRTLERRVWKDFRQQGTNGATRNGNTIQAGDYSRSGGIITLASARGLNTASTGSVGISEDIISQDLYAIREAGAFSTITDKTRQFGNRQYCKLFGTNQTIANIQKMNRMLRSPEAFLSESQRDNGTFGTFARLGLIDDVVCEFIPSDGLADNELYYVPNDDLIEVRVLRMMEEQEPIYIGDAEVRMYTVTYGVVVKSPWLMAYRTNLVNI